MLHACVQRFDVMENLEKFWKLNQASCTFATKVAAQQLLLLLVEVDIDKYHDLSSTL